mmetsp:Transcript_5086/g.12550  ORF Transcript_5086/g.12550 Transcript_5086/m.12550 type:complete len:257 (-) Transcript_5086:3550-4320(-)
MNNPFTVISPITSFSKNTDLIKNDRDSQLLSLIFTSFSLRVSSLESDDAVSVTPLPPEAFIPDCGERGPSSEDSEPLELSSSDSTSPSERANSILGSSSCCPGTFRLMLACATPFLARFLTYESRCDVIPCLASRHASSRAPAKRFIKIRRPTTRMMMIRKTPTLLGLIGCSSTPFAIITHAATSCHPSPVPVINTVTNPSGNVSKCLGRRFHVPPISKHLSLLVTSFQKVVVCCSTKQYPKVPLYKDTPRTVRAK